MKVLTVTNGTTQLVLVPDSELEKELIKELVGATASGISDGHSILGHNVNGGLLIKREKVEKTIQ